MNPTPKRSKDCNINLPPSGVPMTFITGIAVLLLSSVQIWSDLVNRFNLENGFKSFFNIVFPSMYYISFSFLSLLYVFLVHPWGVKSSPVKILSLTGNMDKKSCSKGMTPLSSLSLTPSLASKQSNLKRIILQYTEILLKIRGFTK